jgi:type IV secretory pathway VirB2 component (pilin)
LAAAAESFPTGAYVPNVLLVHRGRASRNQPQPRVEARAGGVRPWTGGTRDPWAIPPGKAKASAEAGTPGGRVALPSRLPWNTQPAGQPSSVPDGPTGAALAAARPSSSARARGMDGPATAHCPLPLPATASVGEAGGVGAPRPQALARVAPAVRGGAARSLAVAGARAAGLARRPYLPCPVRLRSAGAGLLVSLKNHCRW